MDDETMNRSGTHRRRRVGVAAGLLAAGAVGGAVLAGTLTASAASSTASPSTASPSRPDNHGSSPIRGDEKALNASDAAKVKAAALKAVSGGTVYRVETDAGDAVYEAHMTKADGTEVTVKLDKNFAVTAVEEGMGRGDPGPDQQETTTGGA